MKPTTIVRFLLQISGKEIVFTNKRKTFRTVKCYGTPSKKVINRIKKEMSKIGVKCETYTLPSTRNWKAESFIVKLPLDCQE